MKDKQHLDVMEILVKSYHSGIIEVEDNVGLRTLYPNYCSLLRFNKILPVNASLMLYFTPKVVRKYFDNGLLRIEEWRVYNMDSIDLDYCRFPDSEYPTLSQEIAALLV